MLLCYRFYLTLYLCCVFLYITEEVILFQVFEQGENTRAVADRDGVWFLFLLIGGRC